MFILDAQLSLGLFYSFSYPKKSYRLIRCKVFPTRYWDWKILETVRKYPSPRTPADKRSTRSHDLASWLCNVLLKVRDQCDALPKVLRSPTPNSQGRQCRMWELLLPLKTEIKITTPTRSEKLSYRDSDPPTFALPQAGHCRLLCWALFRRTHNILRELSWRTRHVSNANCHGVAHKPSPCRLATVSFLPLDCVSASVSLVCSY